MEIYKENVVSFNQWNNYKLITIEAIIIAFETVKGNFTAEDVEKNKPNIVKRSCSKWSFLSTSRILGVYAVVSHNHRNNWCRLRRINSGKSFI